MFKLDSQIVDYAYTEELIPRTKDNYKNWIANKLHFPLSYLEGDRGQKRESLDLYWDEAKSAVVILFSYHKQKKSLKDEYQKKSWNGLKLASYTLGFGGHDYHYVLKEKLEKVALEIKESFRKDHPDESLSFKLALDIHPVLDRDLAYRSGLGWFGKNSMMINKKEGSFFIIGSIVFDKKLPMPIRQVETDHCGQCTKCIDSCPTDAIDTNSRTIITNRCISTYTIELFRPDSVADEKMDLNSGYIFGCDICQDVCPWNNRVDRITSNDQKYIFNSKEQGIIDFYTQRPIVEIKAELEEMSNKGFESRFNETSFSRSGKRGLLKNIIYYLKNKN